MWFSSPSCNFTRHCLLNQHSQACPSTCCPPRSHAVGPEADGLLRALVVSAARRGGVANLGNTCFVAALLQLTDK